ncbi:mannosyl-oligosaccharide alpha-1,2-mannosidase [Achlya hypogyna]|uniref:alpha-1,2-Mannosidase n=1 Tax=Achlya hypogyna TaxID=1202772 RepID=A0A1V9Z1M5_ACHHY|nr:mannosyl-oligosaccharide alpha-1,2-mannosidase [Achlya hypogyna]
MVEQALFRLRVPLVLAIAGLFVFAQIYIVSHFESGLFDRSVERFAKLRGARHVTRSAKATYPATHMPLETGAQLNMTLTESDDVTQEARRAAIKGAMAHAWHGYENYAFGADEVGPVSGSRQQNVWGDMGVTMVDALDTLYIMDMKDEFARARDWVANDLDFKHLGVDGGTISIFEVTIRELGGLLSAYDLSRDPVFKARAVELADLLAPAFDSAEGVFYTIFNPHSKKKQMNGWTGYRGLLADLGTLQLEMRYLTAITGDPQYAERGDAFYDIIRREGSFEKTGLFPVHFEQDSGTFARHNSFITIGALGDSFYEYLIKVFLFSGKNLARDAFLLETYEAAVDGIEKHLLSKSIETDAATGESHTYYYLKELSIPAMSGTNQQDHLLCFVPGMLALGTVGETDAAKVARHLDLAEKLMETCYAMYARQPTGLAPDLVGFPGFVVKDGRYKLRPETVESLMYMHRITKDPKYREWGWHIFEALEKHAKTTYGYGAVLHVDSLADVAVEDKMESFFMAETLKYHYLLQSPDTFVPLDKYVFNTEAHPFSVQA